MPCQRAPSEHARAVSLHLGWLGFRTTLYTTVLREGAGGKTSCGLEVAGLSWVRSTVLRHTPGCRDNTLISVLSEDKIPDLERVPGGNLARSKTYSTRPSTSTLIK